LTLSHALTVPLRFSQSEEFCFFLLIIFGKSSYQFFEQFIRYGSSLCMKEWSRFTITLLFPRGLSSFLPTRNICTRQKSPYTNGLICSIRVDDIILIVKSATRAPGTEEHLFRFPYDRRTAPTYHYIRSHGVVSVA
jgi:hypothetical protein